jgi:glutamine amidotransferase
MKLAIINYGMGNLRSIENAFQSLGCPTQVVSSPNELISATHIVLPGVGAFADGIKNLENGGWVDALEEEIKHKGKSFLGLCLGMQLFATSGTEHGINAGLNLIPGVVEKIQCEDSDIRIPHIGWNDVRIIRNDGLLAGLGDSQVFYFVHSYIFHPNDLAMVSSYCSYGVEFAASLEAGNICGTQFHPEKSQKAGLKVLQNFMNM